MRVTPLEGAKPNSFLHISSRSLRPSALSCFEKAMTAVYYVADDEMYRLSPVKWLAAQCLIRESGLRRKAAATRSKPIRIQVIKDQLDHGSGRSLVISVKEHRANSSFH